MRQGQSPTAYLRRGDEASDPQQVQVHASAVEKSEKSYLDECPVPGLRPAQYFSPRASGSISRCTVAVRRHIGRSHGLSRSHCAFTLGSEPVVYLDDPCQRLPGKRYPERLVGLLPHRVYGTDGVVPVARSATQGAAIQPKWSFGGLDDVEEADRVGGPGQAVATVLAGACLRETGPHEQSEDLLRVARRDSHLFRDFAEFDVRARASSGQSDGGSDGIIATACEL